MTKKELQPTDIRYLGDLSRIEAKPGDVFVLTCDYQLNADQLIKLRARWSAEMGDTKLMVFAGGMRIGLVNADAVRQPPKEESP